jgi:hypothetical protein
VVDEKTVHVVGSGDELAAAVPDGRRELLPHREGDHFVVGTVNDDARRRETRSLRKIVEVIADEELHGEERRNARRHVGNGRIGGNQNERAAASPPRHLDRDPGPERSPPENDTVGADSSSGEIVEDTRGRTLIRGRRG